MKTIGPDLNWFPRGNLDSFGKSGSWQAGCKKEGPWGRYWLSESESDEEGESSAEASTSGEA